MQNFFEMLKHSSSNYKYLVVGKGHLLDAFNDLIRAFFYTCHCISFLHQSCIFELSIRLKSYLGKKKALGSLKFQYKVK